MLDLVIKGGQVVTSAGVGEWDIWVQGERIVALAMPEVSAPETRKTLDATGKIVVPGGIEAHAHIGFPHMPNTWFTENAGPEEQSRAAIWGGTTTSRHQSFSVLIISLF